MTTFYKWLLKQCDREDPVGELANDTRRSCNDQDISNTANDFWSWRQRLCCRGACSDALAALKDAWEEYGKQPCTYTMRAPCPECECTTGIIDRRGGQDCVFCEGCDQFQYNAPKTETGKARRTVTTVHNGVGPKLRAKILLRDRNTCAICHASDRPLHVGHLLSVEAGMALDMSDEEINDESNLAAMCEECNLGLGKRPLPLPLCISILRANIRYLKAEPQ